MTPAERRRAKERERIRLGKAKAERRAKIYGATGQCRRRIIVRVSVGKRGFQGGGWNPQPVHRQCQAKAGPSGYCEKHAKYESGSRSRRSRFGNSDEPLSIEAQKAQRIVLLKQMKAAIKQAQKNVYVLLKPTYYTSIPLGDIYEAVEKTGLAIPEDEKNCLLTGRDGRATWPLTFSGLPAPARLWITWHKMETGRYEVIGAVS